MDPAAEPSLLLNVQAVYAPPAEAAQTSQKVQWSAHTIRAVYKLYLTSCIYVPDVCKQHSRAAMPGLLVHLPSGCSKWHFLLRRTSDAGAPANGATSRSRKECLELATSWKWPPSTDRKSCRPMAANQPPSSCHPRGTSEPGLLGVTYVCTSSRRWEQAVSHESRQWLVLKRLPQAPSPPWTPPAGWCCKLERLQCSAWSH